MKHGPISAHVNNKVEGMHYRVYNRKTVEFLDITTPSGSRAYTRTLFFVLCKAVHDLFNPCKVAIDIPVSNGYYVNLNIGRPVTLDDAGAIRRRMQEIIDAALPIHRHETTTEEAISAVRQPAHRSKVKLLRSSGRLYTTYYDIDGYTDYYYGSLLTNTSELYLFGLEKYYDGLLLRIPSREHPDELGEMTHQDKMFGIFKEHHRWQDILGMRTIGDLNEAIDKGYASLLIQVSEALQEKKIAQIADEIARRKGVKHGAYCRTVEQRKDHHLQAPLRAAGRQRHQARAHLARRLLRGPRPDAARREGRLRLRAPARPQPAAAQRAA